MPHLTISPTDNSPVSQELRKAQLAVLNGFDVGKEIESIRLPVEGKGQISFASRKTAHLIRERVRRLSGGMLEAR